MTEQEQKQIEGYSKILSLATPIEATGARSAFIDTILKTNKHSLLSSFPAMARRFDFQDGETIITTALLLKQLGSESIYKYSYFIDLYEGMKKVIKEKPIIEGYGGIMYGTILPFIRNLIQYKLLNV
mgnify:CR=1 FL=1